MSCRGVTVLAARRHPPPTRGELVPCPQSDPMNVRHGYRTRP
jgi:hypothetical protein